jgi:hypothetical protein
METSGSLVRLAAEAAVHELACARGWESEMGHEEHVRLFGVSAMLAAWDEGGRATDFLATWSDKTWMNTSGPLYCGNGDNCGTGPLHAPNNVQCDPEGYEVIFRQPINRFELRQVMTAASADPLHGYGCDGDTHWSLQAIRTWWAQERREVEVSLVREHHYSPHAQAGVEPVAARCDALHATSRNDPDEDGEDGEDGEDREDGEQEDGEQEDGEREERTCGVRMGSPRPEDVVDGEHGDEWTEEQHDEQAQGDRPRGAPDAADARRHHLQEVGIAGAGEEGVVDPVRGYLAGNSGAGWA